MSRTCFMQHIHLHLHLQRVYAEWEVPMYIFSIYAQRLFLMIVFLVANCPLIFSLQWQLPQIPESAHRTGENCPFEAIPVFLRCPLFQVSHSPSSYSAWASLHHLYIQRIRGVLRECAIFTFTLTFWHWLYIYSSWLTSSLVPVPIIP